MTFVLFVLFDNPDSPFGTVSVDKIGFRKKALKLLGEKFYKQFYMFAL